MRPSDPGIPRNVVAIVLCMVLAVTIGIHVGTNDRCPDNLDIKQFCSDTTTRMTASAIRSGVLSGASVQ